MGVTYPVNVLHENVLTQLTVTVSVSVSLFRSRGGSATHICLAVTVCQDLSTMADPVSIRSTAESGMAVDSRDSDNMSFGFAFLHQLLEKHIQIYFDTHAIFFFQNLSSAPERRR